MRSLPRLPRLRRRLVEPFGVSAGELEEFLGGAPVKGRNRWFVQIILRLLSVVFAEPVPGPALLPAANLGGRFLLVVAGSGRRRRLEGRKDAVEAIRLMERVPAQEILHLVGRLTPPQCPQLIPSLLPIESLGLLSQLPLLRVEVGLAEASQAKQAQREMEAEGGAFALQCFEVLSVAVAVGRHSRRWMVPVGLCGVAAFLNAMSERSVRFP